MKRLRDKPYFLQGKVLDDFCRGELNGSLAGKNAFLNRVVNFFYISILSHNQSIYKLTCMPGRQLL